MSKEAIHHPKHYGGDTPYEAIKVIMAWGVGFNLGNTLKYLSRAGKKDPKATLQDLKKAAWYLNYEIVYREGMQKVKPNAQKRKTRRNNKSSR